MEEKTTLYESLLHLYYDSEKKRFLNQELIGVIDGFVEYCKIKDTVDNMQVVKTMATVYGSRNKITQNELKNKLALSDSSLYRFRVKLVRSLEKFISKNYKGDA